MSDKDYIKTLEADNERLRAELLLEKETSEKARAYGYDQAARLRVARQDIDNLMRKIDILDRARRSYSGDNSNYTAYDAMKHAAYQREMENVMMDVFQRADKAVMDEELMKYINEIGSELK